jgi:hypothetical protein
VNFVPGETSLAIVGVEDQPADRQCDVSAGRGGPGSPANTNAAQYVGWRNFAPGELSISFSCAVLSASAGPNRWAHNWS